MTQLRSRVDAPYPIAVMSFNRPHYLEQVLRSLKAQTLPIKPDQIFLFQDGYRSRNGGDLTNPALTRKCTELFKTIFPGSKTFELAENLGVALNFARAEDYFFTELGAEAAYFFEDDLVLAPHYLKVIGALVDIALKEKRIAYVAAYGDHRATLTEQKFAPNKLIPMRHKWGFATTHRQWLAQRDLLAPYLDIVARNDYRARDNAAIRKYFSTLGYGSTGTSQDGMKDVASHVLGTTKIMTRACFGKYIGEIGLHSKSHVYAQEGFSHTEIYPDEVVSFELDSKQIDNWIARGRADAKRLLAALPVRDGKRAAEEPEDANLTTDAATPAEEEFIRAIYRVFLLREPDPLGFASALRQLRNGRSYEDLMRWCLGSTEFSEKHQQFLRTYLSSDLSVSSGPPAPQPGGRVTGQKRAAPSVGLGHPAIDVQLDVSQAELRELARRVRTSWTEMGAVRPHHSVLSGGDYAPQKVNEDALARFWASGGAEVSTVEAILKRHRFFETGSKTCVEYGCGLGRVTFALAKIFKRVHAYDISHTHVAQAERRASELHVDNIDFHLCAADPLDERLLPCDFFYSRIVFQHNPPPLIRLLIAKSLEALREEGIAIFQVPTYGDTYSFRLREYLAAEQKPDMEMHCIPQADVFAAVGQSECQILEVREDNSIGRHGTWVSNTFVVTRPRRPNGIPVPA